MNKCVKDLLKGLEWLNQNAMRWTGLVAILALIFTIIGVIIDATGESNQKTESVEIPTVTSPTIDADKLKPSDDKVEPKIEKGGPYPVPVVSSVENIAIPRKFLEVLDETPSKNVVVNTLKEALVIPVDQCDIPYLNKLLRSAAKSRSCMSIPAESDRIGELKCNKNEDIITAMGDYFFRGKLGETVTIRSFYQGKLPVDQGAIETKILKEQDFDRVREFWRDQGKICG
jgi:hypothetical protein